MVKRPELFYKLNSPNASSSVVYGSPVLFAPPANSIGLWPPPITLLPFWFPEAIGDDLCVDIPAAKARREISNSRF